MSIVFKKLFVCLCVHEGRDIHARMQGWMAEENLKESVFTFYLLRQDLSCLC